MFFKINENKKKYYKDVIEIALPSAIQSMLGNFVSLFDNLMIGSLGEASISAVSVCGSFSWLCSTFVASFASGALIVASQESGREDKSNIKRLLSLNIALALFIATIFFLGCSFFPITIIKIYSNLESIVEPSLQYINIFKYTFFFSLTTNAIVTVLRSVRSVKVSLVNSVFSSIINIVLNYGLIGGHLGMPAIGVKGAAISNLIARIIELIITIIYLFCYEKNLKFAIKDFKPNLGKHNFDKYIRITAPVLAVELLSNLVSTVQTMISGHLSEFYISANSIVHMAWTVPGFFIWGFASSCNVMIGESLGNKKYDEAKEKARYSLGLGVAIGLMCSVMVQILIPFISSFYDVKPETLELAKQMGYSASFVVFFLAVSTTLCSGIIKAGGKTDSLLKVDLFSNWIVAIPLGYLCAIVFEAPAYVVYFCLRSGNIVKAIWGFNYYQKGKWIHTID